MPTEPQGMKKMICRIFGHKYEPVQEYYGHAHCERCTYDSQHFEPSLIVGWAWSIKRFYLESRNKLGHWITCPDCKMHFGRHDPNHDHLPF